jgi:molybdopterin-guanine dinucleotide biosynthesis protein B
MKIFAITGISDSGKTQLILKLIGELKDRGHTVSVIKHCPHGFDLEEQGKDSAQFVAAGSDAVGMYSSDRLAILQQNETNLDAKQITREYIPQSEFILVEGGQSDKKLKKIEVLRRGLSEKIAGSPEEVIAIVSDFDIGEDMLVFHPEEIEKIADFLENYPHEKEPLAQLSIDNVSIPMNPFVQRIFTNTVMGMIRSLEGIPEDPKSITLSLKKEGKKDEKA